MENRKWHTTEEDDLRRFSEIGKHRPALFEKFMAWYEACQQGGALTRREKALMGLAVAHALQCPYCIDAYSQSCLEAGSNMEQMPEAIHMASALRGGACLNTRASGAQLGQQGFNVVTQSLPVIQTAPAASPPSRYDFDAKLAESGTKLERADVIDTLQVNVGKLCNQACKHCHVDAGPKRAAIMTRTGNEERYMRKLVESFNPGTLGSLMCRNLISVDWEGRLYDCDFNRMLELGVPPELPQTIADLDPAKFIGRRIMTGLHCFGCAAGAGSSCGGAVVKT